MHSRNNKAINRMAPSPEGSRQITMVLSNVAGEPRSVAYGIRLGSPVLHDCTVPLLPQFDFQFYRCIVRVVDLADVHCERLKPPKSFVSRPPLRRGRNFSEQ